MARELVTRRHFPFRLLAWITVCLVAAGLLAGCAPAEATTAMIRIVVEVDGKQMALQVPSGVTVQSALQQGGITLNTLDRVEPPSYTILADNDTIKVTRIREVFSVEEMIIPFERQTVHNESLPEGKTLLVQQGVNGIEQVTYRQVFEDDREISNEIFKKEILSEPLPEILMVGVQKPFTPVTIPGKIAYLTGGNAWIMEESTGARRPVVTTGDLDGQIFALSPKGDWLLFTRLSNGADDATGDQGADQEAGEEAEDLQINTLWAIDLTTEGSKPIDLKVENVVHFAAWVPGKGLTITYSTVEPRSTAPGWQANNDLQMLTFSYTGAIGKQETILDTNMGGLYGWWGTNFAWSADGAMLAYARPDEVGLVDLEAKSQVPLASLLPFQTGSSWAWVPGLGWSVNNDVLYTVTHVPKAGLDSPEASPLFDLAGIALSQDPLGAGGPLISVVPQAGMFAYPVPAPMKIGPGYDVAYLRAIFPEQSDSKRYRLAIVDRDGSNNRVIFPAEDRQGLEAQRVVWSPEPLLNESLWLGVIYQGNLWLVDSRTGEAQQITGDGLISRIDWK